MMRAAVATLLLGVAKAQDLVQCGNWAGQFDEVRTALFCLCSRRWPKWLGKLTGCVGVRERVLACGR